MREIAQIARFYVINKGINGRSMKNLLDNPNYNPLLKKCVDDVKRFPDWAIAECHNYRDQIDRRTFKFNSGIWAMDIRDEDLPKGTVVDMLDLKAAFLEIINWVNANRETFAKEIQYKERIKNM